MNYSYLQQMGLAGKIHFMQVFLVLWILAKLLL